jgi:hypothetical protein
MIDPHQSRRPDAFFLAQVRFVLLVRGIRASSGGWAAKNGAQSLVQANNKAIGQGESGHGIDLLVGWFVRRVILRQSGAWMQPAYVENRRRRGANRQGTETTGP